MGRIARTRPLFRREVIFSKTFAINVLCFITDEIELPISPLEFTSQKEWCFLRLDSGWARMSLMHVSFEQGLAYLERVSPTLASLLEPLPHEFPEVNNPDGGFFRQSYRYGDYIVRDGIWQVESPQASLQYARVPLGVPLNRVIEITQHRSEESDALPQPRSQIIQGEMFGGFELLDKLETGARLDAPLPAPRKTEGWNLTAGSTSFRFFSNRRDYRKQIGNLLPPVAEPSRERGLWSLKMLKEKTLKDSKQSVVARGMEAPESEYLRHLEDKHRSNRLWRMEVLYFTRGLLDYLLQGKTLTQHRFVRYLYQLSWHQSRERRAHGDVAGRYSSALSHALDKAGAKFFDKLYPLLFDFVLLANGGQMGFRPILEDADLLDIEERGPFGFYDHHELAHLRRPILLLPDYLSRHHPVVFPLSQPTTNGRLEPNSWRNQIYLPVTEAINELVNLGALDPEQVEVGFHYRPKEGRTKSHYWPGRTRKAPGWIRDIDFDPICRCFLTLELEGGRPKEENVRVV